jgi:hypothetical protein
MQSARKQFYLTEITMSQAVPNQVTNVETTDSDYQGLYKLGGAAAIMMVVIIVIQLVIFMTAPPPLDGTAIDWFMLFQKNRFIGLVDFELLMVVYTIISIPVSLALFMILKRVHLTFMALYLALSLVAVIAFISARPAFEMLYLSDIYAAATTDAQKSMLLAAGQTLFATFHGTAFQVSYILGSLTGLILSFVILKSNTFSKPIAYLRIASSVCDFGLYIPGVGTYISIFSVLFLFVWNILIARKLFQLGSSARRTIPGPTVSEQLYG